MLGVGLVLGSYPGGGLSKVFMDEWAAVRGDSPLGEGYSIVRQSQRQLLLRPLSQALLHLRFSTFRLTVKNVVLEVHIAWST